MASSVWFRDWSTIFLVEIVHNPSRSPAQDCDDRDCDQEDNKNERPNQARLNANSHDKGQILEKKVCSLQFLPGRPCHVTEELASIAVSVTERLVFVLLRHQNYLDVILHVDILIRCRLKIIRGYLVDVDFIVKEGIEAGAISVIRANLI